MDREREAVGRDRDAVDREREAVVFRPDVLLRAPPPLRGLTPLVAARCTFPISRATVRLMLRKFFLESFSVRSTSRRRSRPPLPSSFRRSLSAPSAASSDFSSRPSERGDRCDRAVLERELRALALPRVVLLVRRAPDLLVCAIASLHSAGCCRSASH